MAGRGPQPKDPTKRARRNADPAPLKIIPAIPTEQPPLPKFYREVVGEDGVPRKKLFVWPAVTRRWWQMWAQSPLSGDFTETDWSFLLDTALLHAAVWSGDLRFESELRLRVAKFGATPEDRARLRITFADADMVEAGEPRLVDGLGSARQRARSRVTRLAAVDA
ncbi:hypothetical protein I6B53_03315 [Schaalia sp. 19OD2882]|uniref:phage terminase small subunit n=1 Tax=Schaalia sp. 19OD2882 TaxID=2794089 RepID=UPI001C1E9681|nr:hypothetical protein [Schaalia sp. 19OD2882]QWW20140.1 hypothetical protein I6B53_03315 [Schaalia sp. 19OD2882]